MIHIEADAPAEVAGPCLLVRPCRLERTPAPRHCTEPSPRQALPHLQGTLSLVTTVDEPPPPPDWNLTVFAATYALPREQWAGSSGAKANGCCGRASGVTPRAAPPGMRSTSDTAWATGSGSRDMLALLQKAKEENLAPRQPIDEELTRAAGEGRVADLAGLVRRGANVHAMPWPAWQIESPLGAAAKHGHTAVLAALHGLSTGVDREAVRMAYHAMQWNQPGVVDWLVGEGGLSRAQRQSDLAGGDGDREQPLASSRAFVVRAWICTA